MAGFITSPEDFFNSKATFVTPKSNLRSSNSEFPEPTFVNDDQNEECDIDFDNDDYDNDIPSQNIFCTPTRDDVPHDNYDQEDNDPENQEDNDLMFETENNAEYENIDTTYLEENLLMESQELDIIPPSQIVMSQTDIERNSPTINAAEELDNCNNTQTSSKAYKESIGTCKTVATNPESTLTKKLMEELIPSTPDSLISMNLVPESIRKLYKLVVSKFNEASYVYAIAAQLGHDIRPMDFNVNLKMALLFSIVSINEKSKRAPIPVIVIGNDTSTVNLLMNRVGNLAQRFIRTLDIFNGGVLSNKDTIMHAGPLLLAKEGVCYIGDWSRIKKKNVNQLLRFIENDQVILDKSIITYKLQCSIWSYFTILKPKKDIKSLLTFLNIFGIPIICDDNIDDSVINFILLQSMTNSNLEEYPDTIPEDEMRHYLNHVSNIKVQFSTEASKLLNNYFVATRMTSPEVLSQRSFISLKQISESSAKLCFRSTVVITDVILAIYFSELYISAIFGPTGNNSPVKKSISDVTQVSQCMDSITIWVKGFIDSKLGRS